MRNLGRFIFHSFPPRFGLTAALASAGLLAALCLCLRLQFISPGIWLAFGTGILATALASRRAEKAARHAEAKRAELLHREQEARKQAEDSNRAKDEFLAIVSHELRTPLTAMLGWVHLLRDSRLDAASQQRGLAVIERNTKSQVRLIEDLLDVSRIVTGKLALSKQRLEMRPVMEAAVQSVQLAAENKQIGLEQQTGDGPHSVFGDPDRLQQVLYNLLMNAIKFTPAGGRVGIRLARCGHEITITVSDTGIGIDPEFLPHVFERFRQADTSITREYKGLGLGLAIARHLAELHYGGIQAFSAGKNQGAQFILRLPQAVPGPAPESTRLPENVPAASSQRNDLSGQRILVVEDEPDARDLLVTILKHEGAAVNATGCVDEALGLLKTVPVDVLISDIGLPGKDGYTLMQEVRRQAAHLQGPSFAVALTVFARAEDHARALEAGYHTHLSKPIDPAALVGLLIELANMCRHLGKV